MADLTIVAVHGEIAASYRTRVSEWMMRTQMPYAVHNYLGESNSSVQVLARSPIDTVRAELAIRRLSPSGPLFLHREASPFSRGQLERRLLSGSTFGIYDFDDALQWDFPGAMHRKAWPKWRKCVEAVRAADRVVAGNQVLADWASQFCRDVRIVPTCVEQRQYVRKKDYEVAKRPIIGWLGSPSTEMYLRQIQEPLVAICKKFGARVHVMSAGFQTLGKLDAVVTREPWSEKAAFAALAKWDIGLAPLDSTMWSQGKCAYKVLQYAAAGLPTIGSPIGANRFALARLGGHAAQTASDWYIGLETMLGESEASRRSRGDSACAGVTKHYSYDAWMTTWKDVVRP